MATATTQIQLQDMIKSVIQDRKKLLGLSFIFLVAFIWVIASFVVQGIENDGAHPAVLTLVANSLFAVYLPLYWLNLRIKQRLSGQLGRQQQEADNLMSPRQQRSDQPPAVTRLEDMYGTHEKMKLAALFKAALLVAPLWYLAQFTFNASLNMTSVTSNTILSSTSALFTFLFSVKLLQESFTLRKLAYIVALMAGTAMVTLADTTSKAPSTTLSSSNTSINTTSFLLDGQQQQESIELSESATTDDNNTSALRSVIGDMLCLLSAVIYGAYTIAIRHLLKDDEDVAMTLFFGFMGALIFFTVGPILLILYMLGVGLGTLTWRIFGFMIIKGLLDNVLSDYLWARSILLIGPTIATSGLSLQIPLAVSLDAIFGSPSWLNSVGSTVLTLAGGAVVLIGFFGITFASSTSKVEARMQDVWKELENDEALQRQMEEEEEDARAITAIGLETGQSSLNQSPWRREGGLLEKRANSP